MKVSLHLATIFDIPFLVQLEKSVSKTHVYSAMLKESEWRESMEKGAVYLIEYDSQSVGSVSLEQKTASHVHIGGLVISPEFQGRGIGKSVLVCLLERLCEVKRIDLVTHPDNHVALAVYQLLGFAVESRVENYFGDGEPRLILAITR